MSEAYQQLLKDPVNYRDIPYDQGFQLSIEQQQAVQLCGLQRRFAELRGQIGALDKLAAEQGIDEIDSLDAAVPLLFPHTVYKSYPLSFLERGRFDRLTRWLDGITSIDLSGVDVSGIETIDEWIVHLDRCTEIRLLHSSGTTGKLSFIPRTREQWDTALQITGHSLRDWHGQGTGPDLMRQHLPMINPGYRYGASASHRGVDGMVRHFSGGDDNTLFLYPDAHFSADIASLAGRLRAAEARGEQGELELSPALLARRDEFADRERDRPEQMKRFFEQAQSRYAGRDVFMFGVWPILFEWAEEGLARDIRGVFGPDSVLITGGGSKGKVLPDDWREQIFEFLGFENYYEFYGMSELMTNAPKCAEGNFHFPPVLIPYVLDPETGEPLPQQGRQTGRMAIMDLLPETYWGGLVTGDEVTLSGWDEPCACGRHGVYAHPDIRRFSESRGGDDKINCAGAPEAHDRAVDFLVSQTG